MTRIIVICNGGFGKELVCYIQDVFPEGSGYRFDRIQDLHPDDELQVGADEVFVVASGDPGVKARLVEQIQQAGGRFVSVIHPTSYVAPTAIVGEGAILCPFAFLGPDSVLAPHVTLNVHAGCGHDARIGSYTVVSPYAFVAGSAQVGARVFLGSYAFVAPGKCVGENSKLSAGAVGLRDIPPNSLAVGNPAQSRVLFPALDG